MIYSKVVFLWAKSNPIAFFLSFKDSPPIISSTNNIKNTTLKSKIFNILPIIKS